MSNLSIIAPLRELCSLFFDECALAPRVNVVYATSNAHGQNLHEKLHDVVHQAYGPQSLDFIRTVAFGLFFLGHDVGGVDFSKTLSLSACSWFIAHLMLDSLVVQFIARLQGKALAYGHRYLASSSSSSWLLGSRTAAGTTRSRTSGPGCTLDNVLEAAAARQAASIRDGSR